MKGNKKKLSIGLGLLILLQMLFIAGAAQSAVPTTRFTLGSYMYEQNGKTYSMDAAPFAENGRTYVPVAYLAESMDVDVQWSAGTQTVTLAQSLINPNNRSSESIYMELQVDSIYYEWGTIQDGYKSENHSQMDVTPVIRDGRTYLPALYVAQIYGYEVTWNSQTRSVELWQKSDEASTTYHSTINGFSVKIPASWNNKYTVVDKENLTTFYQKRAYDASNGEMGRLFSVVVYTGEEWEQKGEEIKSMTSNLRVVYGEASVFYMCGPTDVQFDYDDAQATSEYQAMDNDIPSIVASFTMDMGL
ncbi:MAG: copper amine oxidase N-terminal domain-containing protein [Syntrophomonadaceae bacterium]